MTAPASAAMALVERLSQSWPLPWQSGLSEEQHPLYGEIAALSSGEPASLPFFRHDQIGWLTVAGDAKRLQEGIDDLRAWLLPSYGWEDAAQPLALPGETQSELSALIFSLSPAGYFRWWTPATLGRTVTERLRMRRELLAARPAHAVRELPSLVELRRQFQVGLAIGARDVAQVAVDAVDRHQLDSASNVRFLQVRLWDRFGAYEEIVHQAGLADLLALPLPQGVRAAILRAFHSRELADLEARGALGEAREVYAARVHPVLGAVLTRTRASEGKQARRLMAYRASLRGDRAAAALLRAESADDPVLAGILAPLGDVDVPAIPLEEQFERAWQLRDWPAVQNLGPQLLSVASPLSEEQLAEVIVVLRRSLRDLPNAELAARLAAVAAPATQPEPAAASAPATASWPDFLSRLQAGDWAAARRFLEQADRPGAAAVQTEDVPELVRTVGELFTSPDLDNPAAEHLVQESLPALIEDFVSESGFPRRTLLPLYEELLRTWAEQRAESAFVPDGQLLLVLASEVLQHSAGAEAEVVETLRRWWEVRRVRARLPFLLEALDLVTEYTHAREAAESLWIDGADFVRRDPTALSRGERLLWRQIGRRIGLEAAMLDECLGTTQADAEGTPDPIAEADLQKIAIVSLQERAARQAAEWIQERTGAEVITVIEHTAGASTANARSSDVILFVWAANKHAVYRAFDDVRNRLAYVQGTGPSSILLALERWVVEHVR
jgi:hypothetical protein